MVHTKSVQVNAGGGEAEGMDNGRHGRFLGCAGKVALCGVVRQQLHHSGVVCPAGLIIPGLKNGVVSGPVEKEKGDEVQGGIERGEDAV